MMYKIIQNLIVYYATLNNKLRKELTKEENCLKRYINFRRRKINHETKYERNHKKSR